MLVDRGAVEIPNEYIGIVTTAVIVNQTLNIARSCRTVND